MFTGLVEAMGEIRHRRDDGSGGAEVSIVEARLAPELVIGESVAINGACLTVVAVEGDTFRFQLGPETLARTNLGKLHMGDRVNLERSLRVGDRLGGHFVQGHVDVVGRIAVITQQGEWRFVAFECPTEWTDQMVPKGSIAVDGVSLTLVDVEPGRFSVMLIPHTLDHTTLGFKKVGDGVNLETDILAKHVHQMLRNTRT